MRLAIVIPGFQANSADWCIPAFTNLARELSKYAEVHVFTLRYPHVRHTYKVGRVCVHALGGGAFGEQRVFGLSLMRLWRDTLRAITAVHRKRPFDTVIGVWATESGWLATRASHKLGVPSIIHLAGGELVWLPDIRYGTRPRSLANALVRHAVKSAALITVPSSPMEKALTGSRLRGSLPVEHWSLGVDTEMFSPSPPYVATHDRGPFTFICVGSLIPVKDHKFVLQAFDKLSKADDARGKFRLQIVGTGLLGGELQQLARILQLKGYVDFFGEVSHDALRDLYQAADCFVIGSRHEAQCMAALEAMACGLPWVGPPVGALADVPQLTHKAPTGIRVNSRKIGAFAEALRTIMCLPEETLRGWGQNATEIVSRDYALTRQTQRLLKIVATQSKAKASGQS